MPLTDFSQKGTRKGGLSNFLPTSSKRGGLSSFLPSAQSGPETVSGLKQIARQEGLGERAEEILEEKGEKPKEIFSGGKIMDIFDVLNTLQYGVVGVMKGKGFKEGVKTRQSFSDKDSLGNYGLPGTVAGIALDIAFDPLTYIPVFGLGKHIVKGIAKGAGVTGKVVSKVPFAQKFGNVLGRAFIYRFGQDPLYAKIAERTTKNIGIGVQSAIEIARPLTKLDPQTQRIIAEARKAGKLAELPEEILKKAKPAFDELDRLGKESVNVGLLKPETYQENVGRYIARLYKKHEIPSEVAKKAKGIFAEKKPIGIDRARFMKRTDIPEDVREAMGEILEAGYPTAKSLVQLTASIERTKFFNEVAQKFSKETAEEGLERLPSNIARLGRLAGKYVPKPIFDDIQEIIRRPSGVEKITRKIVAGFKFGKVILNPASHARNIMSNFLLNDFEGLSPARFDIYAEAAKELAKKGKWYQEAKQVGLGLDTYAAKEVKELLTGPDAGKFALKFKGTIDKVSDLYQKEEEWAKMAQYIFQRKKGLHPEEAWKVAERATFNYSQVTPFIRRVRESIFGYPFITFTYKATPQIAKTLVTKPTKISNIGKIKQGIENLSGQKELERERASEPDWVRDGFYVKLPMKDKHGRSAYLDLSYILPFGDLVSGQLYERGIKRETGLPEGVPRAVARKLAFPNLVAELVQNQDFYGNKIFKESDATEKQLGDIMRHITKSYIPPLLSDQIPGGYRKDGTRRPTVIGRLLQKPGIETGGFQSRTLMQELLRNVGLKVSPVNLKQQERFMEQEKEKALQTLLGEEGITSEFKKTFIPK